VTCVADASVVVAYLLGESTDGEREAMRGDVHAPALLDVEAMQTLRGLVRGAKIDLPTAELARAELGELTLRRYTGAPWLRRCWEQAA
jgi:predicted nucleic acid-binding protein